MEAFEKLPASLQASTVPPRLLIDLATSERRATDGPLLAASREGLAALAPMLARALSVVATKRPTGPLPGGSTTDVLHAARAALGASPLPLDGIGADTALARLARVLFEKGLDLSSTRAAAHLQPPTLATAVVADALASASNASVDTWDSGPSAIAVERFVIEALVSLAGFSAIDADGVMTPGGSISNLLGVLLARDAAALRRGVDARRDGVAALGRPVVFCSELAHFSMHRACAVLGLGENAVRSVPVDAQRRMRVDALEEMLRALEPDCLPLAILATAGTTDFGSIDPLPALADAAARHGLWFHVDGAYGFGALFSDRLAPKLQGIERADSVTLDLHKLGWQPAPASVFLVANAASFRSLERCVAYLNPSDDAACGLDGLLGRSLQTTRRPDAVKVAATFLAHGKRGLGALVDSCHDLARHAEARIASSTDLELVAGANLTTVVFRYRAAPIDGLDDEVTDAVNAALRRRLLHGGDALIGRTEVQLEPGAAPRVCLKLTLMNPTATPADIDALLDCVVDAGRAVESGAHSEEAA